MWRKTKAPHFSRVAALLALVLVSISCAVATNAGTQAEADPPLADLLLTTDDLDQLRLDLWTETDQPPAKSDVDVCGDDCAVGLWSAPGGDLIISLYRYETARAAASTLDKAVRGLHDDLGYEPAVLAGDIQLPQNTWLGAKVDDGPATFELYFQQGKYLWAALLATKYADITEEQVQGFELILCDVAAAQFTKLPSP